MYSSSEGSMFYRFLALVGVVAGTALVIVGLFYAAGNLGSLHCFYSSPMSIPVKPPVNKRYGVDLQRPTSSHYWEGPHSERVYSLVSAWRVEAPPCRFYCGKTL